MHDRPTPARFDRAVARRPGPVLVGAALLWATGGLLVAGSPVNGPRMAFWRSLVGAVAYQAILARRGIRLTWRDLRTASLGGAGFGISAVCLFIAFQSTTLVTANVIGCLQPLILGVIAHRSGGRLDKRAWAATVVAAAGTVIVVAGASSRGGAWSLRGDLFAAAGIVANMVYVLGTKRARATMEPLTYQAAMLCTSAAVCLPVLVATAWRAPFPVARGWFWIVALVSSAGTGHILFAAAQRHVSVAASSAIVLAEVLAATIGAAVLYGQSIGPVQVAGMVMVGGAIASWVRRADDSAEERLGGQALADPAGMG